MQRLSRRQRLLVGLSFLWGDIAVTDGMIELANTISDLVRWAAGMS